MNKFTKEEVDIPLLAPVQPYHCRKCGKVKELVRFRFTIAVGTPNPIKFTQNHVEVESTCCRYLAGHMEFKPVDEKQLDLLTPWSDKNDNENTKR